MSYTAKIRADLLNRAREYMDARRKYVCDPGCLEGVIMACIEDGLVTRNDIVRTVPKFIGHSYAHVASLLDQITGPDPKQYLCHRDENKTYYLHPEPKRRTRAKQAVSAT